MTAPRQSLLDRLAKARAGNHIDLRCTTPAFQGLHVRCRSLTPDELQQATDVPDKDKGAAIKAALSVLTLTCVGVWEEQDGVGVSPIDGFDGTLDLATGVVTGSLPTFADPELAQAFGVDDGTAAAACRALLAPNSDLRLIPYGDAVAEFSMGANDKLVREATGN